MHGLRIGGTHTSEPIKVRGSRASSGFTDLRAPDLRVPGSDLQSERSARAPIPRIAGHMCSSGGAIDIGD